MKIRAVEGPSSSMNTDGHDEANIDFSKFCEGAYKARGFTACLYATSVHCQKLQIVQSVTNKYS
jgi:hypothetical protein